MKEWIQSLMKREQEGKGYSFNYGQLRKNGRLMIGPDEQLRKEILQVWHNSTMGGHSGMEATYRIVAALFY